MRWGPSLGIPLHSISCSASSRVPLKRGRVSRAHTRRVGRGTGHPISAATGLTWIVRRRADTRHSGGATGTRGKLSWMGRRGRYRVAELVGPNLSRGTVLTGWIVRKPPWTARRRGRRWRLTGVWGMIVTASGLWWGANKRFVECGTTERGYVRRWVYSTAGWWGRATFLLHSLKSFIFPPLIARTALFFGPRTGISQPTPKGER